jgi:CheY-like chemotaxis protein
MSKLPRLLLIDDPSADVPALLEELRRLGCEPARVTTVEELRAALAAGGWDFVLEAARGAALARRDQSLVAAARMVGGVAHDFNNLLTIINGFGEVLRNRLKPGDPLHPLADEIVKAADRAAELTGRLRAFSRQHQEAEGTPPSAPRGHETLLLADDEVAVRALSGDVLRQSGYTVLEAGHGHEALRVAEGHAGPIHLLVSDVVMPELDGRQLAERLRQVRPELKVLFVSGYTGDEELRQGVRQAAVHFLPKPYTPLALATKVRAVLDQAEAV